MLPGKIIFPFNFLTKCLINWQGIAIIVFLMDFQITIRFLLHQRTKKKQHSLALMECLLTKECILVFAMPLLLFKHACLLYFQTWLKNALKFSWMIFRCLVQILMCLENLALVLKRCQETSLVLNWEKCHFMVKDGIVLGNKISEKGIEVDRAKIEVISKLPPPVTAQEFS